MQCSYRSALLGMWQCTLRQSSQESPVKLQFATTGGEGIATKLPLGGYHCAGVSHGMASPTAGSWAISSRRKDKVHHEDEQEAPDAASFQDGEKLMEVVLKFDMFKLFLVVIVLVKRRLTTPIMSVRHKCGPFEATGKR